MKKTSPIIWNIEKSELIRVTRIANELTNILRKDHILFSKISKRTRRWIAKQDKLAEEQKDEQDRIARTVKLRQAALSKLTRKEQEVLGLANEDADEGD